MAVDDDIDVRARSPLARLLAWVGPPREYRLTGWLLLRLLGVVYVFAFLGLVRQGPALLGADGLTPIATYVDGARAAGWSFWDLPSIFWWGHSDGTLQLFAYVGLALSLALALGVANMPLLFALWVIYGSFVRVGQLWFGFGWEIQILETTLVAMFLAHPWHPRRSYMPPLAAVVLARWLVFRIMLGAGLIKLRGSDCWHDLSCLDAHFETQPIPNPLSAWFHELPHVVKAGGVAFNHFVEVLLPWFVFGPRRLRIAAGLCMAAFQVVLIVSGNLAFLNWLTLVPIIALFDDDFLRRMIPRRWRRASAPVAPRDGTQFAFAFGAAALVTLVGSISLGAGAVTTVLVLAAAVAAVRHYKPRLQGTQLAVACFAGLVAIKSIAVVENLASRRQAMNRSYDRFALVNTYGAFGSVTLERHELVIEGSIDGTTWHAYELPCKPGDLDRRPCILGPYHRRLDWLIWFAAMSDRPGDAWIVHFLSKLLDGDPTIRTLLAHDPFAGRAPALVRIRRFRYHLQPLGAAHWWTRDDEQLWVPPMSKDSPELLEVLRRYRWAK
jgi:Lipase maturation factor